MSEHGLNVLVKGQILMQLTATSWSSCSFASSVLQVFIEIALYYLIQPLAILRNIKLMRKLPFCTLPYFKKHDFQFCTIFWYYCQHAHCFVTVVLDTQAHSKCRCVSFIHNQHHYVECKLFNVMRYCFVTLPLSTKPICNKARSQQRTKQSKPKRGLYEEEFISIPTDKIFFLGSLWI